MTQKVAELRGVSLQRIFEVANEKAKEIYNLPLFNRRIIVDYGDAIIFQIILCSIFSKPASMMPGVNQKKLETLFCSFELSSSA